jgi:hypothetical protein
VPGRYLLPHWGEAGLGPLHATTEVRQSTFPCTGLSWPLQFRSFSLSQESIETLACRPAAGWFHSATSFCQQAGPSPGAWPPVSSPRKTGHKEFH